jgi:hypothetical protein
MRDSGVAHPAMMTAARAAKAVRRNLDVFMGNRLVRIVLLANV